MSAPTALRQDEAQVARLAAELLEVTSEEELEDFLGSLASSVIKGAKSFMKSGVGKAIGGALKNIAKTALPAVGGALGSFLLPGVGTAIGARLGSVAGGLLEVGEAEALGEAEAEYEAAQRYVRFARSAYVNAARAPRNAPPRAVARAATVTAARRYAPGLLRDRGQDGGWGRRPGSRRRPGSLPAGRVPHVRLGRPLGRRRQRRIHLAGLRGAGVDAAGGPRPRRRSHPSPATGRRRRTPTRRRPARSRRAGGSATDTASSSSGPDR